MRDQDLVSIENAAKELHFPGGRNALYQFLRKHAGFQHTTPPHSLVRQGFFCIKNSQYQRGPVTVPTRVTRVTPTGLSYIAELMGQHLNQEQTQQEAQA